MKKEPVKPLLIIRNPKGERWNENVSFQRHSLLSRFAKEWLPLCHKISDYEARTVWAIFENNGWSIEEIELPADEK